MDYTFRPIQQWPRELTRSRKNSLFYSTYSETLGLLNKELKQINARNVVIQLALTDDDIRRDGLPRANSRPSHPGVILSFEKFLPKGKLVGQWQSISMPCDQYRNWEDNLRAIALSLEALRKVDRYGVTQNGEQYTGWTALPEPNNGDIKTPQEAAAFIAQYSDALVNEVLNSTTIYLAAYRMAARRLHPDTTADKEGATKDFQRLQQAKAILDQKFKGTV